MGKVSKRKKSDNRSVASSADVTNILSGDPAVDQALTELGRILAEIAQTASAQATGGPENTETETEVD